MIKYAVRLVKNKFYALNLKNGMNVNHGDHVVVMTDKGEEVAQVFKVCSKVSAIWEKNKPEFINVIKILNKDEVLKLGQLKEEQNIAYNKCLELISKHNLGMNLVKVKYTYDKRKITFYYTAKERIDFRELLKDLTQTFKKTRIDLRHIGVRDETSIMEGVGICGKEFCCCSFLRKFDNTNIKLAKDQNLPITPGKVSGTCGRLLCCLNYEYSNYIEAAKGMPPIGSVVMTSDGLGKVCQLNFLNSKIYVKLEDGKIKEYSKDNIEMVDTDVNIDIETPYTYTSHNDDIEIDIKQLEDDRNSSTGNV